jgi:NAD(P)-dependent dehydrogenase (short-subunit alcohol dehydrogenase family)
MAAEREIAVVVGAAGGIGRALLAGLDADPRFALVAALSRRRPDGWPDDAAHSWRAVDILDEPSLIAAAADLAERGAATRIVVATGLLHAEGLGPEKSMAALDPARLAMLFAVNAIGPALVAKHFLSLAPRDRPSVFAALSARVGSLGDNALGGWHGYRASKAALNMFLRTAAVEHSRTRPLGVCVALHPGTVATALSAPYTANTAPGRLFSPEVAAGHLLRVMDGLRPAENGGFFAWDGTAVPW